MVPHDCKKNNVFSVSLRESRPVAKISVLIVFLLLPIAAHCFTINIGSSSPTKRALHSHITVTPALTSRQRRTAITTTPAKNLLSLNTLSPRQHHENDDNALLEDSHGHGHDDDMRRRPRHVHERRSVLSKAVTSMISGVVTGSSLFVMSNIPSRVWAGDDVGGVAVVPEVQVSVSGDTKQLFNEGRYLESQGNIPAAQRIYAKVTKIVPRFIYGWSNLGNTQVALGALATAEESYSTAIDLCNENLKTTESKFGVKRCDDLYILLLNRGALRLNNNMPKEALVDLEQAADLRGKPDAVILQNRARAREIHGLYSGADRDYTVAISMTSNDVAPFWLRSAMVKFQNGDLIGALDLARRVDVRFGEAPEVRAALAALLMAKGDSTGARRKYLEIPDRQRENFVNDEYLKKTVAWPPAMIDSLAKITNAVGEN